MTTQKSSAPAAATDRGAWKERIHLHITIPVRKLQGRIIRTSLGAGAWAALILLLGTVGGMERGTVGLIPGTVTVVVCIVIFAICLKAGGWME